MRGLSSPAMTVGAGYGLSAQSFEDCLHYGRIRAGMAEVTDRRTTIYRCAAAVVTVTGTTAATGVNLRERSGVAPTA